MSDLDYEQVITQSGDDLNKALRVLPLGPGGAPSTWDFVARTVTTTTVPNDTERYVFKTGGAAGTTVFTWTLVYTDATLNNLLTATRT